MSQILDASAESLVPFVQDSVEPGSVIHTDGWLGYLPLERNGYNHDAYIPQRQEENSVAVDAASSPRDLPAQALADGNSPGGRSATNVSITIWTSSRSDSSDENPKTEANSSSV